MSEVKGLTLPYFCDISMYILKMVIKRLDFTGFL